MVQILIYFLIVAAPVCVGFRFLKRGAASAFNFSLYPLVFGYFYLLVPSLVPFVTTLDATLAFSVDSFEIVDRLSAWSVSVFLVGYLMTKDYSIDFNGRVELAPLTLLVARFFQVSCFSLAIFVLVRHGPSLYALSGDRALSYDYYAKEIIDAYRLPVLFAFSAVSSTLLYLRFRSLVNLLPMLPFAILDALQGGRGYTFAALVVLGLNYLAVHMDKFRRVAILMVSLASSLFASAFVRRYLSVDDTSDPMVIFFGEFFFTRLTSQFAIDNMAGHGDLVTYMLVSVSKLLPQFLVAPFFNSEDLIPYHVVLNDWVGASFGLAGSVMSEALYYGDVEFAIVSPVLISAVFFLFQSRRVVLGLPGYLFFIVISSSMYLIFRTGFYTNFFSIGYMFLFYFSMMILPSYRARVFFLKR